MSRHLYAFQRPGTPGITDGIKQVDMKKEAEDEHERPGLEVKVEARDGTYQDEEMIENMEKKDERQEEKMTNQLECPQRENKRSLRPARRLYR